jgi:hypothetical protein
MKKTDLAAGLLTMVFGDGARKYWSVLWKLLIKIEGVINMITAVPVINMHAVKMEG